MQMPRINLAKYFQVCYGKNYETLFKQFMENLNKWIISCSQIERLNIIKM